MPSPFPGMDPFLEGSLWPDIHHNLASALLELIIPQIRPKYTARIEPYTRLDPDPKEDIGIMYPDVEVLRRQEKLREPEVAYEGSGSGITPPTLTVPEFEQFRVRIPVVEIRDLDGNRLITAIEILSPVNKRKAGSEAYQKKRRRLHKEGVHLLEIDLLRRGTRPFYYPYLPECHYLMALTRSGAKEMEVWAIDIKDDLPVLPVPLLAPDADANLPLGKALQLIYDRYDYGLSVDYDSDPPPPAFSEEDRRWMRTLLKGSV